MASYMYSTAAAVRVLKARAAADATEGAVRRAAAATQASGDVLVLVPSTTAGDNVRRRLEELGASAGDVRVATPRQVALQILGGDEAFFATGRKAHVLTGFELAFLNEDVGVLGTRGKRVRELIKFLERGWSEMREDEEDWLVTGEETAFERFLKGRLGFFEVLHPAEVEAVCVRYLAGSPHALEAAQARSVVVCDARSMCRASQVMACMLAKDELTFSWDGQGALAGEDPYPYDGGLDELLAANPAADVVELAASHASLAVTGVVERLQSQRCEQAGQAASPAEYAPKGSFEVVDAGMLADEMDAVVDVVRARLEAGLAPQDVFVATPTDAWTRRVRSALSGAGIASDSVEERQALNCDVRDSGKSIAVRVATAIALLADPDSAIAWRCWCGYGDYLTHSGAFADLFETASAHGNGLVAELEGLAESGPGAAIAKRFLEGRAFIARANGLAGHALVSAACEAAGCGEIPEKLAALLGEVGEGDGARALYDRISSSLLEPRFAPGCVRVGAWERLLGDVPQLVVFCGMVNGLVPDRGYFDLTQVSIDARAKMREKLLCRLSAAASRATSDIVCTTFSEAGLVEAETLKLDTDRIRLVEGRRICSISPSACIGFMRG